MSFFNHTTADPHEEAAMQRLVKRIATTRRERNYDPDAIEATIYHGLLQEICPEDKRRKMTRKNQKTIVNNKPAPVGFCGNSETTNKKIHWLALASLMAYRYEEPEEYKLGPAQRVINAAIPILKEYFGEKYRNTQLPFEIALTNNLVGIARQHLEQLGEWDRNKHKLLVPRLLGYVKLGPEEKVDPERNYSVAMDGYHGETCQVRIRHRHESDKAAIKTFTGETGLISLKTLTNKFRTVAR